LHNLFMLKVPLNTNQPTSSVEMAVMPLL